MNIKLIDGLMLLDIYKNIPDKYAVIMIGLGVLFIIFLILSFDSKGIEKIITCIFAVTSIVFLLLIGILKQEDFYKVAIVDNNKCTIQDLMKNYKIIEQEGAIYNIQLEGNK